jgi:hypothetical protein
MTNHTDHQIAMRYYKGFTTGAGLKPIDASLEKDPDFKRGMDDGVAARSKAMAAEYKRLGLPPPNPLRLLEGTT